jgi:glycosyltransferase involved in cell wall biosynthesis
MPSKRVIEGIEAVSQVNNAYLVIAGDGPLRNDVDAAAGFLLGDRFRRLTTSPDKMPELYRCADVFLHLAKEESFGNVYLEAMASGLPVVAHDTPRARWILGDNQFLIDSENRPALQAALEQATSPASEGWKTQQHERSISFSWDSVAAQYRRFFREIVDTAPAAKVPE